MELVVIIICGIAWIIIYNYRKKLRQESDFPTRSQVKHFAKTHNPPTRAQKQMVSDMLISPEVRRLRSNPPQSFSIPGSSIPYMPPPLWEREFNNYQKYIYKLVNAREVVRAVKEMKEVNRIYELPVIPLEEIREIEKLIK